MDLLAERNKPHDYGEVNSEFFSMRIGKLVFNGVLALLTFFLLACNETTKDSQKSTATIISSNSTVSSSAIVDSISTVDTVTTIDSASTVDTTLAIDTLMPPKPEIIEIAETDSTFPMRSINGIKWQKIDSINSMSWVVSLDNCAPGFRLPTVNEFKNLEAYLVHQGDEGKWWTSSVAFMGNADSIPPRVFMAQLAKGAKSIQFVEVPFSDTAKVQCIQDSNKVPLFENPEPLSVSKIQGYISGVSLEPYFERSEDNQQCADCCCGEGNGGKLTVSVNTENGEKKSFEIFELSDSFCGTKVLYSENNSTTVVDYNDNCVLADLDKYEFIQLFQPGVKVKQTSCKSRVFINSEMGDSYEMVSCGDSISLEFSARVVEKVMMETPSPDDPKKCSYMFALPDQDKNIQAAGPCGYAAIGEEYDISVEIVQNPITGSKMSPIWQMFYPCCYGEVRSYYVSKINFIKK